MGSAVICDSAQYTPHDKFQTGELPKGLMTSQSQCYRTLTITQLTITHPPLSVLREALTSVYRTSRGMTVGSHRCCTPRARRS